MYISNGTEVRKQWRTSGLVWFTTGEVFQEEQKGPKMIEKVLEICLKRGLWALLGKAFGASSVVT